MKTQTKAFSIELLRMNIESGAFLNTHSNENSSIAVNKHKNGIAQAMIYAIEYSDGSFCILENNVIGNLIKEYTRTDVHIREHRQLGYSTVNICILSTTATSEEIDLFKTLTINS